MKIPSNVFYLIGMWLGFLLTDLFSILAASTLILLFVLIELKLINLTERREVD